jgi:F-type H+-transporting ATPase subunit delta
LFSLASDDGRIPQVRDELDAMAQLIGNSEELQRHLLQPLHPVKQRSAVLAGLCARGAVSPTVQNFFAYLIDQRRLVDFAGICEEFGRLADEAAGRLRAQVRSASPLREDQRERLVAALSRQTGKQIELETSVDPSLIGGAIATVDGVVFDGSLKTQLSQLRSNLTHGRS